MDFIKELVPFVFWAIVGSGILFGIAYLLMIFGGVRERIIGALNDIEALREKVRGQREDIEKLKQSVRSLGAPISYDKSLKK